MQLNDAQKEAVEYLDGPLLVLAGPGTGKTQLLSEKVAYILQKTDASAENILCLTFTDSGASNMRERLKTIIEQDALKVTIGTYHTFGSEILAMYKNYAEDYERKLDQAIDEVRQFKIVKSIQDKLPGTDILRGDAVKDIISVISDAKGARLSADDLAMIARQNIDDSKVLSEAISPLLKNVVPRKYKESYENAYLPIYEFLKQYEQMEPIVGRIERSISGLARDLGEAIQEAETLQKVTPLSDWKNKYFELDSKQNYRLKDVVANKKLASLARVMASYEQYLLDEGLYDFDDMIEEAVKVLKQNDGFRATLAERYQYVLLDEFQDTNPSQLAIVKAITDYEKPVIMAVGDDDQAIYEFQGALASNVSDYRDYYNAKVVKLVENYRSTQEILDFSRQVILQAPDRFEDKALHSNRPAGKTAIYRYEFNSSDAEYGFVADKIAELVASGVEQKQIAVISAKHKYFEPFLPYLKAKNGLKIAYEKRDDLFQNEQIHEVLTLARFVYELANEKKPTVSLLEVLSFPFFELPALEIVKLTGRARAEHRQAFEYLAEQGSEGVQLLLQFLADLAVASFNTPLEIMLDYLMGLCDLNGYTSPFMDYYASRELSDSDKAFATFTLYENIASLRGKLNRHFGDKKLKLVDLVEMVDDYEAAEMPLITTSPYRDAEDAVQIMSAHKAKGLEFEHVFILSADHMAWGKGKGNNNLLALPQNVTQIRHTGTTDSEKLRVLYVALTRAKKGLYITNSLMDFNGKSPERLEYFNEFEQKDEAGKVEVISPFLPNKRVTMVSEVNDVKKRENNVRNWLTSYFASSPDMRELYLERVKGLKMTASVLTSFIDIIYGGPVEFFRSRVLLAPDGPETESQVLGNLIHATFDEVTRNELSDAKAVEFYEKAVEDYDTTAEIREAVRAKGIESIVETLNTYGEIIRAGKSEVNFASEKLVVEGVPVTGKIDHIVVDDNNKTIEVYDCKTGSYRKEGWKSHPTLYEYMLQLLFYKMLLNASPTYRKYKVTRGHILFVVKDKADETVHDKVYEYDNKDEQEMMALLKAVYRQITSLEFMDDAEVMVTPDKGRAMKDIKAFIALLLAKE